MQGKGHFLENILFGARWSPIWGGGGEGRGLPPPPPPPPWLRHCLYVYIRTGSGTDRWKSGSECGAGAALSHTSPWLHVAVACGVTGDLWAAGCRLWAMWWRITDNPRQPCVQTPATGPSVRPSLGNMYTSLVVTAPRSDKRLDRPVTMPRK